METEWLVGESGLFCGSPTRGWSRVGAGEYTINAIAQLRLGLVLGSEGGCWLAPPVGRWVQWHDETLTSVMGIAPVPVGVGVVAATAFGVATAEPDALGVPRWQWHSDELGVNARYCNAILPDPDRPLRWIVGTEAGVLIHDHTARDWLYTSLSGRTVRTLCRAADRFWAGTDGAGVWCSSDGLTWTSAGSGLEAATVYSLAWAGDRLLAGLEGGLAVGDGFGPWSLGGPALRVRTVGAAPDVWVAGASPGGLWFSADRGCTWRSTGSFLSVRTVAQREA